MNDTAAGRRTAVVLFNLGGPDGPAAVAPFLFNLFSDPAIIRLPNPLRWLVARLISRRRAPQARAIYDRIGGASPLLAQTKAQATALDAALADLGAVRVFIAMRYWHPRADRTAAEVRAWAPDRVVLLPLYPQFSTTTTASSLAEWRRVAAKAGLVVPTHAVCCYPDDTGLIAAQAALVRDAWQAAKAHGQPRVLFSAHGLPKKIVAAGDPYQWQVERTAAAIVSAAGLPELDWSICYQSRVGPLEWIGPLTESEIERAGRDRVPLVVVPVAFVSEHSETLVELDLDYRERARVAGVPAYFRVPTVGTRPEFIAGLAHVVRSALERPGIGPSRPGRLCPGGFSGCPANARNL